MRPLVVWAFTNGELPRPTGLCTVSPNGVAVVWPGPSYRIANVNPRDALSHAQGSHVTRFSCRPVMRDDQGTIYCKLSAPTLHYDAAKVLRAFARRAALDVADVWDAPSEIRTYLRTGTRKLADVAWVAAASAARRAKPGVVAMAARSAAAAANPHHPPWDAAYNAVTEALGAIGGMQSEQGRQQQRARFTRMLRSGAPS